MTFGEVFGSAQWVGPDADCQCPYLRQLIELDGEVGTAEITICGLGFFELYVNGTRASGELFTPVTSDYCKREFTVCGAPFIEQLRHRTYFVRYDIAELLTPGPNALCVALAPGWFGQPTWCDDGKTVCFGDVRLAFHLDVRMADGTQLSFESGPAHTRWAPGPVVEYDLFTGERHDLRLSHDGWLEPGYAADEFAPTRALPDLDTRYQLQDCPADAVIRHIRPRRVATHDGCTVYDAGENISGTPVLRATGAAGDQVTLRLAEELSPDGTLDERYTHGQCARFVLDGQPRELSARFTWFGFRYFSVEGPAEVVDCLVIHSDIAVTAEFDSDSPALNWLFDAYVRTQLTNMHAGIPSDCPHIERRGYTGDGQLTCQSAMLTLDARAFYQKWLRDIEDCQDDITGHVQYTAPYTRCGGGPGGWGCAIVHVPYCFYLQYGDAEPMRRMLPRMFKYFDYLEAHSENGLVTSDNPGQWCLGDWCTPDEIRIPEPLVNNYFYIKSMREVLAICDILGDHARDAELGRRIAERSDALMRNYFDPATGDFAGNVQGANAFMLDIGLGDERTFANMARHYAETGCFDTGIFGTDIVPRVLFERGCADTAYALLASDKPVSFDRFRQLGATTLWEYWPLGGERSHSHPMFGGPVRYLFEYLLGIGQRGAGWDQLIIKPRLIDGLSYVRGSILTPHGRVSVRINRIGGEYAIDVNIDDARGGEFELDGIRRKLNQGMTHIIVGTEA